MFHRAQFSAPSSSCVTSMTSHTKYPPLHVYLLMTASCTGTSTQQLKQINYLQDDIDRLQKWESDWLMEFNPDKCEIIRITNRRKKKVVSCYSIHGKALNKITCVKYLVVTIDRKLTWNDHIDNITNKANNARAFLQRNISSCPQAIKSRYYQTFVRPIVEYASTVWDPSTKKYTKAVENVQRQAAHFIMNDYRRRSSVGNMLESLEWKSLQRR